MEPGKENLSYIPRHTVSRQTDNLLGKSLVYITNKPYDVLQISTDKVQNYAWKTQLSLVLQSAVPLSYFYFAKNSETEQVDAAVTTCIREIPGSNIGQDEVIVTKVLLPRPPEYERWLISKVSNCIK